MFRILALASLIVIAAAWLIFVLSFFLPATNVLEVAGTAPGTPLTGWQAFDGSIRAGALNPWAWLGEPRVILFLVFPLANVLMLVAPLLVPALREFSALLTVLLVPGAIVPWFMPRSLIGELFVGFYYWNGSFLAMAVGCALASAAYAVHRAQCPQGCQARC